MTHDDFFTTALTRRAALARLAALGAAAALGGCASSGAIAHDESLTRLGRLQLGTLPMSTGRGQAGAVPLGLARGRDGIVYTPASAPAGALPLVLLLHGAGGSAQGILRAFQPVADVVGCVLVVPDSRGATWDFINGPYGPDLTIIESAIRQTVARQAIDVKRLGVAGFSDGASYALSVGLTNGDVFGGIAAFSPGLGTTLQPTGQPRVYVAHGTRDTVLPIDRCSRPIVARLKQAGYAVELHEFDGGHQIMPDLAEQGLRVITAAS